MMIQAILTDFSRVLLLPADENYTGGLNALNNKLLAENLKYNFWDFFALNTELLNYFSELNKTTPVHVFTSEMIQDHPSIKEILKNSTSSILSASKLGINKSKRSAYENILSVLSLEAKEVVYIDDKQENLDVAEQVQVQTVLFKDTQTTIKELNGLLNR